MKEFSTRLLTFIRHTNLSNNGFGEACGLSGANIHQMVNAKGFGVDKLLKIFNRFPELNPDWLFSGEGEMLKKSNTNLKNENVHLSVHPNVHPKGEMAMFEKEKTAPNTAPSIAPNKKSEETQEYKKSRFDAPKIVTVDNNGRENIIMLDAKAAAGFPANIDNPEYFKDKPTFSIPTHHFSGGSFIALQASGDSMHPTIYNHDWLFCKFLECPENNIKEGYIHVLLTKEGVVVKRLLNRISERGTVVCQSDNPQYPSYEEKLSNILQIWKVESKLSFILRNESADLNTRLNSLEADMVDIKRHLKG